MITLSDFSSRSKQFFVDVVDVNGVLGVVVVIAVVVVVVVVVETDFETKS